MTSIKRTNMSMIRVIEALDDRWKANFDLTLKISSGMPNEEIIEAAKKLAALPSEPLVISSNMLKALYKEVYTGEESE